VTPEREALEDRIQALKAERQELAAKNTLIQAEIAEINSQIRGHGYVDNYTELTARQAKLKSRSGAMMARLGKMKVELTGLNVELTRMPKPPTDYEGRVGDRLGLVVDDLVALQHKYQNFAKDNTRVNSMRLLAGQVAADLLALIRKGQDK